MIDFKRQILVTTCLVLLLPHFSVAGENEHERYVPKQILEEAKKNLEAQANALGVHSNTSLVLPEKKMMKKVRMVGPIFDFEKAAGIKPATMDADNDHGLNSSESDALSAKSAIMDGEHNAPVMHEGFADKAPKDVHNDGHDAVIKDNHMVAGDLEKGKDEHHKNIDVVATDASDEHMQKNEHGDADMSAKTDMHAMDKESADSHVERDVEHSTGHSAEHSTDGKVDEHMAKEASSSHEPEMFKSVLDEQREKEMHGKAGEHAGDGHGMQAAGGASKGEHAEDGHSEGEHGEGEEHVTPEIVFEIVEVPRGLDKPTLEIRALQRLQDGLVSGAPDASNEYRAQLKASSRTLKLVNEKTWQYKKNLDAVALFTLIGGDPKVGKIARSKTGLSKDHTLYLDAALAYSEGKLGRAYNLFKKIDFKHVPNSTAAQFAIVKSMLFGRSDAKAAKDYLNLARKFAPGTLAEEASLRRLIRMSSDNKDIKLFVRISRIYISRFKNSFYFNDFLKNYAYSLVRMPKMAEEKILSSLKHLFKSLKGNQQLAVASYVSGITTEIGMFKLSAWTSKVALSLSRENGKLHTRMKLYHLASTVTQLGANDTMMDIIEGINDDVLNTKDKQLYNSVIALSQRLFNDPMTQDEIKSGIRAEATRYSKDDTTKKLFDESAVFARNNVTIKKSIDILAKSDEVLKGSSL